MRIVGIGGGTGLPVLLRGLRQAARDFDGVAGPLRISAVVAVSDNGGSSGHLRQSYGIPAVGDLRNCLVALSEGDKVLSELFQYRFNGGSGLHGHALGNLIVTALCQLSGGLGNAAERARQVLGLRGWVYPVTESAPTLCAELESGATIRGESQITQAAGVVRRIWLDPPEPPAFEGVLAALATADAIVLGPGSLYTSILPNLLVRGVAEEIRRSPAVKIFVCNLATQRGETEGFSAAHHLAAVEQYLGQGVLDCCLINSRPASPAMRERYGAGGSEPVAWCEDEVAAHGVVPVIADLLEENGEKLRHDSLKLARAVIAIARNAGERGEEIATTRVAA